MKNKRWQNLAFGLAFTLPVIGAYIMKRLISQSRNRTQGTRPELTRIRVPLTSLIGINADIAAPEPKQDVIVLPAVTEIELDEDTLLLEPEVALDHYIASNERGKFHRPDCRWAQNIKPENSIFLESKAIALERGYTPCASCNP